MKKKRLIPAAAVVIALVFFSHCLAGEHLQQGNRYFSDGKLEKAIAEYELAVTDEPQNFDAYDSLARTCLFAGRTHQAIECYKEAEKLSLGGARLYEGFGSAYQALSSGQDGQIYLHKAVDYYNQALAIDPNAMLANLALGIIYQKQKDYDKAIQYLSKTKTLMQAKGDLESAQKIDSRISAIAQERVQPPPPAQTQ
jgi:tetratricopeptide (TPR) repeat protein